MVDGYNTLGTSLFWEYTTVVSAERKAGVTFRMFTKMFRYLKYVSVGTQGTTYIEYPLTNYNLGTILSGHLCYL